MRRLTRAGSRVGIERLAITIMKNVVMGTLDGRRTAMPTTCLIPHLYGAVANV
jgi:hypothetical protein